MDLFATKLRSMIRGVLNESNAHGGYVQVVDNLGISSNWILTIGCEIVIPKKEFEFFAGVLRKGGMIPQEEDEPLTFDTIEDFYDGYNGKHGWQDGVFTDSYSGKQLRDHMRSYSLVASELMSGVFDRITRDDFDKLVLKWRHDGYSTEGQWQDGTERHGPGDPRSEYCKYCAARFKQIGGGLPSAPGGMMSDQEKKRKLNSNQGGWCCGDPVRPRYFGFQKSRARQGTPEWIQYQYDEVVHLVMREYKRDVVEAIVERLGLENDEYAELRNTVFGVIDKQGMPENFEFKEPEQRYTKRYLGAPPHMQHSEFKAPSDVYLSNKAQEDPQSAADRSEHRVYYVQVKIHLDPKNSSYAKWFSKKLDAINDDKWSEFNDSNYEEDIKDPNEFYSGFVKLLMDSVGNKKQEKTDYTYTSPSNQTYTVYKIATGIRGLNFLADPFMPTKQSEVDRRPQYHGKKELPSASGPDLPEGHPLGGKGLGFHQSDMYGAFGGSEKAILDDLTQYFEEFMGAKLAPWDPVKPFPIGHNGDIYFIPDDDVIILPSSLCPCTGKEECHGMSCDVCHDAETGICRKTKEISGKILRYNETDRSITMRVNSGSCIRCKKIVRTAKIDLAKAEMADNSAATTTFQKRIEKFERILNSPHVETFKREEYLDISKTDFASEEYVKATAKFSNLGTDSNTYSVFSTPWLLLNLKRLEESGEPVQHPFKRNREYIRVTGEGGLFEILLNRTQSVTGEGGDIKAAVKKMKRKLLRYFQNYDRHLLDPDKGKVKYGEETVDISGLNWMDKIAIPLNFSLEPNGSPVMYDPENPSSRAAYERWLTTKRVISTNIYMQIIPQSILKKHLGLSPEEELVPVIKAGAGTTIPYVYTKHILDDEGEPDNVSAEVADLADALEEPEEEGEEAQVELGPGGTPYAPESQPENISLSAGEEVEEEEEGEEDLWHTGDDDDEMYNDDDYDDYGDDEETIDEGYYVDDFGY